ncbi:hypothetical protein NUW54_g10954 [Trametes sanguinea]|uniref:Uncharacterized protein n=1 Tax=Trametes sanguinea TaxID=158606 RepID=A0ACC1NNA6_9APHY|nr:hypothetical protein NUW54_g10954 [Trametes sanguinea]
MRYPPEAASALLASQTLHVVAANTIAMSIMSGYDSQCTHIARALYDHNALGASACEHGEARRADNPPAVGHTPARPVTGVKNDCPMLVSQNSHADHSTVFSMSAQGHAYHAYVCS